MANSPTVLRRRTCQKSKALLMLLTSGVIRSASVDPPCMAAPRPQMGSPRVLSLNTPGYARLIYTTNHVYRMGLLTYWHSTFFDILKEFGRR